MFSISYDQTKNRITVKVSNLTIQDVPQYIEEFKKVVVNVSPGFTGLTDLSEGKLFSQEVALALAPLGELSIQKGLHKWAYVTGSATAKLQMRRMFGDIVVAFEDATEAELFLTNKIELADVK